MESDTKLGLHRATQQYMTVSDVERETGIGKRTIQRAVRRGALRAHAPGGRAFLIAPDDLRAWLETSVVTPTQAREAVSA